MYLEYGRTDGYVFINVMCLVIWKIELGWVVVHICYLDGQLKDASKS